MPESRSIFEKQDIYSKLEKVNKIILEPDFWGNKSKAEKTLKEKKLYEDLVQSYDNSLKQFNEIIDLYDLALEENNKSILKESESNILNLHKNIKKSEIKCFYQMKQIA